MAISELKYIHTSHQNQNCSIMYQTQANIMMSKQKQEENIHFEV